MERPAGIEPVVNCLEGSSSAIELRTLALRFGQLGFPLLLLALSACADKPAPLDNAFCRLFVRMPDPADAVHLKKRENKIAILTNEQTWLHECTQNGSGLTPGPR